eukprot:3905508-Pyramimonas_sp.AAC.1
MFVGRCWTEQRLRHPNTLMLDVRRAPHRGDAPRHLMVRSSWRALSGHAARETIYYKMGMLHAGHET